MTCRKIQSRTFFLFLKFLLSHFSIRDHQELCNLFNPHQWICTTTITTAMLSVILGVILKHNSSHNNNPPPRILLVHYYEKNDAFFLLCTTQFSPYFFISQFSSTQKKVLSLLIMSIRLGATPCSNLGTNYLLLLQWALFSCGIYYQNWICGFT